jgi:uncharacterized RDD family membrane protein YckC
MTSSALADTLQPVELADGVSLQLRVAGPAVRALAWLVDLCIAIGCYIAAAIVLGIAGAFTGAQVGQGLMFLFMFLFNWFYNVFFEMGKRQATPGQRGMGLKVASVSGAPPRLPQSLIRNLLRTIDFLPFGYFTGLICTLSNRRFQRLGDLVADTVVVYADEKQHDSPEFTVNATPMAPPVALSREEQASILAFMERAPQCSDARRLELSDVLAPLTKRTGMPGLQRLCGIGLWLSNRGGNGNGEEVAGG